jgi:hypothetical protein
MPLLGPVSIPEGVHNLRLFSVDVSGRQSLVSFKDHLVDLSPPVITPRTTPPAPATTQKWSSFPNLLFRELPDALGRAVDGDQNGGVTKLEYKLDAGLFTNYTGAFSVPEGVHTVTWRATDGAGRVTTLVQSVNVDVTPPVATALAPSPLIWLRLLDGFLGAQQDTLNFRVQSKPNTTVNVIVQVYNLAGLAVRRIDAGVWKVPSTGVFNGSIKWDGADQSLIGFIPVGVYYYRITAVDEAGSRGVSGESKPIQVKLSVP